MKRNVERQVTVFLFAAVLLLIMLCGCAGKAGDKTTYIGIISAMDNEIDVLLEEADIDHVDTIGDVD